MHADFAEAIRLLAAAGVPDAEIVRRLRTTAARLGRPRPSYSSVRRIAAPARRAAKRRAERVDRVLADLLAGLVPKV